MQNISTQFDKVIEKIQVAEKRTVVTAIFQILKRDLSKCVIVWMENYQIKKHVRK